MSREPIHLDPPIPLTSSQGIVDSCLPSPATDIWSAVAASIGLGTRPGDIESPMPRIQSEMPTSEHHMVQTPSSLDDVPLMPEANCAPHCCTITEPDCAGYVDGHHDWTPADPVTTMLHGGRGVGIPDTVDARVTAI